MRANQLIIHGPLLSGQTLPRTVAWLPRDYFSELFFQMSEVIYLKGISTRTVSHPLVSGTSIASCIFGSKSGGCCPGLSNVFHHLLFFLIPHLPVGRRISRAQEKVLTLDLLG